MSPSDRSNVRHGTLSGYNWDKCRCDACRAAKAAWARDTGANLRIGKRADQKRASDRKRWLRDRGEA